MPAVDEILEGKDICICAGSGGVGKTTTSAAIAAGMAARGLRVCVLTIDPAKRLADSLGDSGMIGVVICVRKREDWEIDTWLMSCRVLGRMVESAVLQELVRGARPRGIRRLVGTYVPTARNKLVEEHYAKLGFDPDGRELDGSTRWALLVEKHVAQVLPMEITRSASLQRP